MSDVPARLAEALSGRYEIERKLGEGGMATVYLADDRKHARKVALKVLKPELAAVVGAERFLSEIKTTANLQHPHILPLFDSGEADGFLYYVMPFIDGESLEDRLKRERQLPVEEAVAIAVKVAGALQVAHDQGIVHRDIKPANVLLASGEPLIADFGIALAVQEAGGGRLTETGLSMGTPFYMSPEQATADRTPDARADVYSLGCMLYEMLAGEPPFTGPSAQAILGRILTQPPRPVTEERASVPPNVGAAIERALQKLPADRFASASEFARALKEPGAFPATRRAARDLLTRSSPRARAMAALPWVLALGLLLALVAVLMPGSSGRDSDARIPVVHAVLELPPEAAIVGPRVAISRDGSVVVVEGTLEGRRMLLARDLGSGEFRPVTGTEGAEMQFLSPDGRFIGFRAGGGMRRVALAGGTPAMLDPEVTWAGGDWTEEGVIVYTRSYRSGIWMLSPDSNEPRPLTEPSGEELGHWWPQVLPGGRHVLFTAFRTPIEEARIEVVSIETGERRVILRGAVHPRYVESGHLLFARGEALHAVSFDPATLTTRGEEVTVVEDLAMDHASGLAGYDVSLNGTLVYLRASDVNSPSDLVWVDRSGREEPALSEPGRYATPALSPRATSIAVAVSLPGQSPDVWRYDLIRGTRTRIGAGGGTDWAPVWAPAGDRIVYVSETPVFDLYSRDADGGAPAIPLVVSEHDKYTGEFTPDGRSFLFVQVSETNRQLWRLDLQSGTSEPLLTPEFDLSEPALTPDGRWIAYVSYESGGEEVYLASFPDVEEVRRQVSNRSGRSPRWTRGGRELVFMEGTRMMSVTWDPATGDLGRPELLFEGPFLPSLQRGTRNFDVTADGERFLMVKRPPERAPRRVVVITGFLERLKGVNFGADR